MYAQVIVKPQNRYKTLKNITRNDSVKYYNDLLLGDEVLPIDDDEVEKYLTPVCKRYFKLGLTYIHRSQFIYI